MTGPSQIRYINYYHQFINNQVPDHFLSLRQPPVVQLYSLSIDPPPLSDLNLTVEVYPMDRQDLCVWKKKYKDVTLGLVFIFLIFVPSFFFLFHFLFF